MADHEIDRVAMPSLKADGTPDQTPGFEAFDEEATKVQKEAQSTVAASNEAAAEETAPDPEKAERRPRAERR